MVETTRYEGQGCRDPADFHPDHARFYGVDLSFDDLPPSRGQSGLPEGFFEFQANASGRGQTSGSANARLRVDRFRIGAFALQASGGFDEFIVSPPFVLE